MAAIGSALYSRIDPAISAPFGPRTVVRCS
jgi:hypothetical protein